MELSDCFWKQWERENSPWKIALLPLSKLLSTEKIISKALIDCDIIHKEFLLLIHAEQNYRKLTESIQIKDSQLHHVEQDRSIEHRKMLKILKQNDK